MILAGFFLSRGLSFGDALEEVAGNGLAIQSNPAGAAVYIDGIERGTTPLGIYTLKPGEYRVWLKKDGYVERRVRITLHEGSRLLLTLDMEAARGRLLIRLNPAPGAPLELQAALRPEISVDGTPVSGLELNLPAGYRTIRVRAFGWQEELKTLYVAENETRQVEFTLLPAEFKISKGTISRPRFNPGNSGALGTTGVGFEVSAPGTGRITIINSQGEPVWERDIPPFQTWSQGICWDGRAPNGGVLPDGAYQARIEGESMPRDKALPVREYMELAIVIDSRIVIRPLSLASGIPGLLYAPVPDPLPQGAFQIEGALLFGQAPMAEKSWAVLPFSAGFRAAPLEGLEFAAALNVQTNLEGGVLSAAGGSLKWRFLKGRGAFPPDMGAGLAYAWVERGPATPFGMDTGIKLFIPGALRLGRFFSLLLSPAILWTGSQGYPAGPIPRLHISSGIQASHAFMTGGVSLRSEFRFGDTAGPEGIAGNWPPWAGPLLLGAELKIFPPPSNFVVSLFGGGWFFDGAAGLYGGAGIGLIY